MIHVFCNKRGSGKTKALINLANEKVLESKGHVVYINDDKRLYWS
jgi:DNA polymerase III delta prime subunit